MTNFSDFDATPHVFVWHKVLDGTCWFSLYFVSFFVDSWSVQRKHLPLSFVCLSGLMGEELELELAMAVVS